MSEINKALYVGAVANKKAAALAGASALAFGVSAILGAVSGI
jgi:hypothetical protein